MTHWQWFQLLSFQVIWLASVLGGNQWLALPLCLLAMHAFMSPCLKQDLKILPLALLGISADMGLSLLGVYEFSQLPAWLLVLWLGFVLNFGHSLRFLRGFKTLWLMLLGAVGGCYAYLASWKLGAVYFPLGAVITSIVIAAVWSIMLPLLVKADTQLRDRHHE